MPAFVTSASGLRAIEQFLVDEDGFIYTTTEGADGDDGRRLEGAKSYNYQVPAPRAVDHSGDDSLIASDSLAPASTGQASMSTAKTNPAADAEQQGTKVHTIGELEAYGLATDKMGQEPDMCVTVVRRALDTKLDSATFGKRRWQMRIHPICRLSPQGAAATEAGADENAYTLAPTMSGQYPWGVAFSEANNGFSRAAVVILTGEYLPRLHVWKGNGTIGNTTPLNVTYKPVSVAKTDVWVDGTPATVSSVDTDNRTITLDSNPTDDARIVALYETSEVI